LPSDEKTVLVTGATRGIGLAIAKALGKRGYSLVLAARDANAGQNTAEQLKADGVQVRSYSLNLSSRQSVQEFCDSVDFDLWGLVNNAGICSTKPIADAGDTDVLDETLQVNLIGPYLLTSLLLNRITRPGRIVNIASQLGLEGRAGYGAYCASKFGLIGLTKCWAKELGAQGITVNAVCPGWVSTDMSVKDVERLASESEADPEQYYADICAPLELKRFNTPQEVANLVCFLMSEEASGITGRDWLMQTIWNQL
jgi:NAD(P)-dependent dehydrogenase (short-subunit alcohol dehydrogenase family)